MALQTLAGLCQSSCQDLHGVQILLEALAHDLQGLPEALLADLVAARTSAVGVGEVAGGQRGGGLVDQLGHALVETGRAELVPPAV